MALGVLLLSAAPAAAHNSLTGSNPADGARVAAAPARIELRFLARTDPATTKITVTGPDNVPAAGGAPTFSGNRVNVPFKPGAAGLYIVGYQVASSDGHPIKGEVRFTLTTGTPAESPSATPAQPTPGSATPSPAVPPTAATPTSPPAAVPAADDRSGWLWALAAVPLAAALAAVLLLRRRRANPR